MKAKRHLCVNSNIILPPINKSHNQIYSNCYSMTEPNLTNKKIPKKINVKKIKIKSINTKNQKINDDNKGKNPITNSQLITKINTNEQNDEKLENLIIKMDNNKIDNIETSKENDDLFIEKDTENFKEILDFVKDLDYEKYKKDTEIQEALELLKSKMIKDRQLMLETNNEENETDSNIDKRYNTVSNDFDFEKNEREIHNFFTEEAKQNLKEQNYQNYKKSLKENVDEYLNTGSDNNFLKFKIAERIAKYDPRFNVVHSYKSIQKIMEKNGIRDEDYEYFDESNNRKENDDIYYPTKLPYLRTRPILQFDK